MIARPILEISWVQLLHTQELESRSTSTILKGEISVGQVFAVDWSETCKFHRINLRNSAVYLKFCGVNFGGLCLERSQNEGIGGKVYKKYRIFVFELLI